MLEELNIDGYIHKKYKIKGGISMEMYYKKILAALCVVACILSLSGCGKVDLGVNTKIDEKGAGEIVFTTVLSGIFAQQSEAAVDSEAGNTGMLEGIDPDNPNITTETKEENGIKTITSTFKFNNLDELNGLVKDTENEGFVLNVEKKSSFFKTQYIYTFKLPSEFSMDSLMNQLKSDENLTSNPMFDTNTISSFIGSAITFKNTITVPGKIISSNAAKSEQNTLTWEYTLSQIKSGDTYTVTYEITNTTNIALAATGAIILIVIAAVIIIKRKNPKI